MNIININGPINAGKTTMSLILREMLDNCLFIEVDDLLSDNEQEKLHLSVKQGWAERVSRLASLVEQHKLSHTYQNIIFAYPMTDKLYHRWKSWEDAQTKFINITLAPKLDVCLKNRGTRILSEAEKTRIKQMYFEGYHCSKFADLILDNSLQTPQQTAQIIAEFIRQKTFKKGTI